MRLKELRLAMPPVNLVASKQVATGNFLFDSRGNGNFLSFGAASLAAIQCLVIKQTVLEACSTDGAMRLKATNKEMSRAID